MRTFGLSLVMAVTMLRAGAYVVIENVKYELDGNTGTAQIVGYEGEPESLAVSSVEHDGRSYAVTSMKSWAFGNCPTLESVSLPQVTSIGGMAFYNCGSLAEVDLPNVEELGEYVFYKTSVTQAHFSKLRSLGNDCFNNCKALVDVNLPLVTNLPLNAFIGCRGLKSFSSPNLTRIDRYAFNGCTSLESVDLPKVEVLGSSVFFSCSSLSNVSLPCLKEIGTDSFRMCGALVEIDVSGLTNVPSGAFCGCSGLRTISLPNVTSVGDNAFQGCESLNFISLPKAEEAGGMAFLGTAMTNASFAALKSVGEQCFYSCMNLVDVDLPAVTNIADKAFGNCLKLERVSAPLATVVGSNVFTRSRNIKSLSLPALETVGDEFYTPTESLEKIELGGWKTLDATTFSACPNLKEVSLTKLEQVPAGLFRGHAVLKTLDLPAAMTVEAEAFFGCSSLEVLNLPAATLVDGEVLDGFRTLRVLVMPAIETISSRQFENCANLSVLKVGAVDQIGDSAFAGCSSLSELTLLSSPAPTVGANAFSGIPSAAVVKVLPWAEGFPSEGEKWNGMTVAYIEDHGDPTFGVTVNGADVGTWQGDGWSYTNKVLTLSGPGPFVLSGRNVKGDVSVVQAASATVIFSNLVLQTSVSEKPTYMVGAGEVKDDPANAIESVILLAGVNSLTCAASATLRTTRQAAIFVNNGSTVRFDTAEGVSNAEGVLYATGGGRAAAIGGGHYCSTGRIVIDGGTIIAESTDSEAAAIGNGSYGGTVDELPGAIEINGGLVKAATIGSAKDMVNGLGFDIRVTGGTVVSTSEEAKGIYSGMDGSVRSVLVTGGSIQAPVVSAVSAAGETLYRARLTGGWADGTPLEIDGPEGYGTHDVVAMNGEVDIWFVKGLHFCDVNGATYRVSVSETGSEASRYEPTGVTINGAEIVTWEDHGAGWTYSNRTAVLTGAGPYWLSGTNKLGRVRFEQTASKATVVFSNLFLEDVQNNPHFRCGANMTLKLTGDNHLNGDVPGNLGDAAGISVPEGCRLTIQALEGVPNSAARLTVRGGYDAAGIGGGYPYVGAEQTLFGTIIINGGTVDAQGGWGGAGIGSGYTGGVQNKSLGAVTINGGVVTARGGKLASGIGWGYSTATRFGKGCDIRINGGTVLAERGEWEWTLHGSVDYKDIDSGMSSVTPVRITGGNVVADEIARPENNSSAALWCVTVPCEWPDGYDRGVLTGLSPAYNITGSCPCDGNLYIWLPSKQYEFQADNAWFTANVQNAPTTAVRISQAIGDDVEAVFHGQEVRILGTGRTYDFAGAAELPWYGRDVTTFQVDAAVIPGANLFAGLSDGVSINGSKVSVLRQLASGFSLGGFSPAEAKALAVENGEVKLTVEVEKSRDLENWETAETVEIAVPVEGEKGFYILKSK